MIPPNKPVSIRSVFSKLSKYKFNDKKRRALYERYSNYGK